MDSSYWKCGSARTVTGNQSFAFRSWTMPGFLKAAAIVMSGGVIIGVGVLATLPGNLRQSSPLLATSQIGALSSVPCDQQLWLNADRMCQTWTRPHRDVQHLLSPEPATAEPSREPPPAAPTASTRLTSDESATRARPRASRAAEIRAARIARGEFVSRRIRMAARPVNNTQPGFMFWPTAQQNNYSYRPRSLRRSTDVTRMFALFGAPAR
jgi:hypothetical protein